MLLQGTCECAIRADGCEGITNGKRHGIPAHSGAKDSFSVSIRWR